MKKLLASVLATVCLLCLAVCFVGCDGTASSNSAIALSYGEKYYWVGDSFQRDDAEADKTYYIFNKDGTGTYHYFYEYVSSVYSSYNELEDFTVTFDYSFLDKEHETIVCTFQSVEYAKRHMEVGSLVESSWDNVFTVSENAIMSMKGTLYYSASYLNEHPNFCKK